jgi:hypothetical protein
MCLRGVACVEKCGAAAGDEVLGQLLCQGAPSNLDHAHVELASFPR